MVLGYDLLTVNCQLDFFCDRVWTESIISAAHIVTSLVSCGLLEVENSSHLLHTSCWHLQVSPGPGDLRGGTPSNNGARHVCRRSFIDHQHIRW